MLDNVPLLYRSVSICEHDGPLCLFELMLYVPVNSKGHVRMSPPFYPTKPQKAYMYVNGLT